MARPRFPGSVFALSGAPPEVPTAAKASKGDGVAKVNGHTHGILEARGRRRALQDDEARRCPISHTPNAITTAPAKPNQVMAYCR
jgi:hypothetical protein